ncbi:MAG TPA: DUF2141 domain-containing protein [Terracidiphilus sp.]|jgi:uncharacterized protein (DUF2141 family)
MRFRVFPILMLFFLCATGVGAGAGSAAFPGPPPDAGCTLRIHVDGLRNSTGVVGAAIFKSPDGWPENMSKALHDWPTPIAPGTHQATATMNNLPPGDYGVVAIHDENTNRKLDRNFFGIPKEGFGFANNPHVGLSAPPFNAALVHVTCPVTDITIHLIYK